MKNLVYTTALLFMVILSGCATTTPGSNDVGSSTTAVPAAEPTGTLHIEYVENQPRLRAPRYNSIDNETDRFYFLQRNFEKVFKSEISDYDLNFQLYPGDFPDGEPVLELTFLSLDSPSRIELELRIWAILKIGDEQKDFGITLIRTVPQRPMTSSSIDRDIDEIYTESAKQIVKMVAAEL